MYSPCILIVTTSFFLSETTSRSNGIMVLESYIPYMQGLILIFCYVIIHKRILKVIWSLNFIVKSLIKLYILLTYENNSAEYYKTRYRLLSPFHHDVYMIRFIPDTESTNKRWSLLTNQQIWPLQLHATRNNNLPSWNWGDISSASQWGPWQRKKKQQQKNSKL